MEIIKPDINIDFVGKRKWAFLLSGLLVLVTIASLVIHSGPNYGIDFAGGIEVRVRFTAPTDPAAVKQALKPWAWTTRWCKGSARPATTSSAF